MARFDNMSLNNCRSIVANVVGIASRDKRDSISQTLLLLFNVGYFGEDADGATIDPIVRALSDVYDSGVRDATYVVGQRLCDVRFDLTGRQL